MNREEAKELMYRCIPYPVQLERIGMIYDDFESRVCDNCKYIGCTYMMTAYETDGLTHKEFGCNQFEAKCK